MSAGILFQRDDDARILLALRAQEVADPDLWGTPGGHAERGESPLDTAIIEATEELGQLPANFEVIGEYSSADLSYTTFHAMINGHDANAWTPSLNWENADWGWFSVDVLPENTHPGVLAALESMTT